MKDAAPATSKLAAATVPVVAGRVTPPPPPVVREPVASSITVPPVVADTAMLPKFRSIVLVIEIGVMMVADADAVAVDWANELFEKPNTNVAATNTFAMFFILVCFFCFCFLNVVCLCCCLFALLNSVLRILCQKIFLLIFNVLRLFILFI